MLQVIGLVIALLTLLLLLAIVAILFSIKKNLEKIEETLTASAYRVPATTKRETNLLAGLHEVLGVIEDHLRTINRNVYVVSRSLLQMEDSPAMTAQKERRVEREEL
jgi:uncharacterized protein YoxC